MDRTLFIITQLVVVNFIIIVQMSLIINFQIEQLIIINMVEYFVAMMFTKFIIKLEFVIVITMTMVMENL